MAVYSSVCEWEVTKSAELTSKLLNLYCEREAGLEQIQLSGLVVITTVMAGFTILLAHPPIRKNIYTYEAEGRALPKLLCPEYPFCD